MASDRRVLPLHAVNVFKVAADGHDCQQNGAWRVDSYDHFTVHWLNAHVLVVGEDLRDVTGRLTDPPPLGRSDHEASGTTDLLFVQNRYGQSLLWQRSLPHFKAVHLWSRSDFRRLIQATSVYRCCSPSPRGSLASPVGPGWCRWRVCSAAALSSEGRCFSGRWTWTAGPPWWPITPSETLAGRDSGRSFRSPAGEEQR